MKKRVLVASSLVALVFCGCAILEMATQVGTSVAVATGHMTQAQADSAVRVAGATGKALEKFTPENEYYMGRTVSALVLDKYKVYDNRDANRYLNVLGRTVSLSSDRPETFKGYHFVILDTDEVNAFATPGGFILVSRGLMKCCRSEDALAAVLAHEVAHVELEHGIKAVESGRRASALAILGVEAARNFGSEGFKNLVDVFGNSMEDIAKKLMLEGYPKEQEFAADKQAVAILRRAGYHPGALKRVLEEMAKVTGSKDTGGFGKTHPSVADRISGIEPLVKDETVRAAPPARQTRFAQAIKGV